MIMTKAMILSSTFMWYCLLLYKVVPAFKSVDENLVCDKWVAVLAQAVRFVLAVG